MIIAALGLVLILIFIICKSVRKRIKATYYCHDGSFVVHGNKDCFRIEKGKRFVFTIKDGQIVSFIDKNVSNKAVNYWSAENGDN